MSKGGAREGAGRPKQASTRVRYSVRIEPGTMERIKAQHIKVGPMIDKLVKELFIEE